MGETEQLPASDCAAASSQKIMSTALNTPCGRVRASMWIVYIITLWPALETQQCNDSSEPLGGEKEKEREREQHPFLAPTLRSTNPVRWRGRESPCHRRLTQIWHAEFLCSLSLEHEGCFGFIVSGKDRKSWMFQERPMFYWEGGTVGSQFRGRWAFRPQSPAHILVYSFFSHQLSSRVTVDIQNIYSYSNDVLKPKLHLLVLDVKLLWSFKGRWRLFERGTLPSVVEKTVTKKQKSSQVEIRAVRRAQIKIAVVQKRRLKWPREVEAAA